MSSHSEIQRLLSAYGLTPSEFDISLFGTGLIHSTFVVSNRSGDPEYILQEVNHHVFTRPADIAHNLSVLEAFPARLASGYFLPLPMPTLGGDAYAMLEGRYFRLTRFVHGTHTAAVCTSAEQAYEAAQQFGRFTSVYEGLPMSGLRDTIDRFHDLSWRWQQFEESLADGNRDRISACRDEVGFLTSHRGIVHTFESIRRDPEFRLRVTHHDTKISNVLFSGEGRGVCVIDLDTVMPGYFISDLGDMFRTYLPSVSEEERDLSLVDVRRDFKEAIIAGYLEHMRSVLTQKERSMLDYAGAFMIYMQALRFLSDHFNDDRYYGAAYEGHNLCRARNQIVLLERYLAS